MSLSQEPPNPIIYTFVLDRLDERDAVFAHPSIGPLGIKRSEWESSGRPGVASLILSRLERDASITRGEP